MLTPRNAVFALTIVAGLAPVFAATPVTAPRTDWQESVQADEPAFFAGLAKEFNAMQDAAAAEAGGPVDRGFHAKPHAVVRAELKVDDNLPEPYRQGAFAKATTYKMWLRMSNGQGKRQADRSGDIRGFAVKILDVPGESLTAGLHSLDFLCINHAAQPARDIHQFIALVRAASHPLTAPIKLAAAVGIREATRLLTWVATHLGKRIASTTTLDYFSALPLTWGKYAAKVKFQAHNGEPPTAAASDENYLRHDLEARLAKGDLHWDMMVQLYQDEATTPIEDASVEWSSPFVKVGEVTVTKRDLTSAAAKAEEAEGNQLLWNPWNAPAEHRPLGSVMRARRVVYPASGAHRGATHE